MFKLRNKNVDPQHYFNTLSEVNQQPDIWSKAFETYVNKKEEINNFIKNISQKSNGRLRIIFTGAGTSEYVGNTIVDHLKRNEAFTFESIATTDLVSCPRLHLKKDQPTLLVSFARSGNSPESIAAVDLANQLVENIYHLAITCAADGKLALQLSNDDNSYVLLMPDGSNDKGFAMTSSFSSMMLSALLIFDKLSDEDKENRVKFIIDSAKYVLSQEEKINELGDFDFSRIVYLGSGPLYGLSNECRLKILELTAGEVAAIFESSMGFRHGPKSFINKDTFVIELVSNDPYTRQYDEDILNEVYQDQIAKKTLAISPIKLDGDYEQFIFDNTKGIEDVYLCFPYVVIAQLFSIIASVHVGNKTDTPSKTGTVNRVVKGVQIHQL